MFAEVLDQQGDLADASELAEFAAAHQLPVGRVSDLVDYRLKHHRTVELVRSGDVDTEQGVFKLCVYRERTQGHIHLALVRGDIDAEQPTLVRVHTTSTLRDFLGVSGDASRSSWSVQKSLSHVADAGTGVVVLLNKQESDAELLSSVDSLFGEVESQESETDHQAEGYTQVGMGAQILRDLGVGKIRLMGMPLRYNSLEGFGLDVVEFIEP